jgi:hypothetical protein
MCTFQMLSIQYSLQSCRHACPCVHEHVLFICCVCVCVCVCVRLVLVLHYSNYKR